MINRFGRELYGTFFRDYTEKVWGVPCNQISAEWGAQRVKGLSISKAVWHKLKAVLPAKTDIRQKNVETSLIERFLYPKFGPGQMWEVVADKVKEQGAENDLLQRIEADPLFAAVSARLDELTQPERFVGRAPEQVDGFLAEVVEPLLAAHEGELEGLSGDVRV